ncbi:MAG: Fic family protein [Candidatus Micrarchaeia archaeon]
MRKYDVLKCISESQGITPKEISVKLNTSLPNIYIYLKKLEDEGLVKKSGNGYFGVPTNKKYKIILNLRAISLEKFHYLITPKFGSLISKLCNTLQISSDVFTKADLRAITKFAIPLRIVLKLTKKPKTYCLKINESIVCLLLEYHGLKPNFNLKDFQEHIKEKGVRALPTKTNTVGVSDKKVIELCESNYQKSGDIEIILKSKSFILDGRLAKLLDDADMINKEYQLFIDALAPEEQALIREQWITRYVYNTNKIEGNTMTQKDVALAISKKNIEGNYSKKELYETNNTYQGLVFLERKLKEEISEELIKELHFLVQMNIDPNNGEYKNIYNYVGALSPTTPPQHVRERMKMLVAWYHENKGSMHPLVLASMFHMQYELIHPFEDGNGRVGRLLMNKILEMNGYLPLIISEKNKQNYYQSLENRSIPMFLLCILAEFIEDYKR